MEHIVEVVINWIVILMAVVGGASLVVQGLAKIAAVTPSTRDDEIIGKVDAFLVGLIKVLDKLALNLPADKARKQ
ncbi:MULTISPECIES: hypothetical protein [Aeromonas]|jgi:hypothetical protein|uniref:hypothetical protein n=1 Tax=Aeromonas TaxID=642 RepID=UPI00084A762A|nr:MULTISPECIES: hypothetical protein [Aeromonas]MBM0416285.1 hypothetical protein [Aeromonas veronii]MBW3788864.1 hypothetical protein [Aeromonas veronii]NJI09044.1 hypothetical protein [Aeromonas veronii]OEC40443.1 hypothetical protein A9G06_19710 [Aeromonas sp. DNP9]TNI85198.1 hypothetical protein CF119_11695 [Aeromonas sobria]